MFRLPVFDIRVVPQKRSAYTKMAVNDLALQLFSLGFFRADMADQALRCLTVMDFEGKDALRRVIEQGAQAQLEALPGPAAPANAARSAEEGDRMTRFRSNARNASMPNT